MELVTSIAIGPTKAFGAAKDILRHFEAGGVPEANAHTTAIASELFNTEDLQGGMGRSSRTAPATPPSPAS